MEGPLTPVVLIPQFTGFAGADTFTTVPLRVEKFSKGTLTLWRGQLAGQGTPTFSAYFEESHDTEAWSTAIPSGDTDPVDPGASSAAKVRIELSKRWLRVRIALTGEPGDDAPMVTAWCVGSLEQRIDDGAARS